MTGEASALVLSGFIAFVVTPAVVLTRRAAAVRAHLDTVMVSLRVD